MADFNTIQRGELQERLSKGLQIRERSPAPTLEPTVQSIVVLEDLTKQTPFLQPNSRRAYAYIRVGAVAANFPYSAITNPASSGLVMLVEQIITSPYPTAPPADVFSIGRVTGAVPTALAGTDWFDRRNGPVQTPAALVRGQSQFAASQIAQKLLARWGDTDWLSLNFVLLPGESLGVERETVNQQADFAWTWIEYVQQ